MKHLDIFPDFSPRQLGFRPLPAFSYEGNLRAEIEASRLRPDQALDLLRLMIIIRKFEDTVAEMKSGAFCPVPGFTLIGATHLSAGQEAVSSGIMSLLRRSDYITSTHRGHGHCIAKGYQALRSMSEEELIRFIEGTPVEAGEGLWKRALAAHLYRTWAELLGKEAGYCGGRGGGMHIADMAVGNLGANAIVGGSAPIATGAAMSAMLQDTDNIVVCLIGDGAINNGVVLESLNMASMKQFGGGIPVLFAVENNQYGMTGQAIGEVTGLDHIARRAAGFNLDSMHAEVVCGMDVLAVMDAGMRAIALLRSGRGPVFLEFATYRYYGHSLSDDGSAYRSRSEVAAWRHKDPIAKLGRQIVEAGLAREDELTCIEQEAAEIVKATASLAAASPEPDPCTIGHWLISGTQCTDPPPSVAGQHYFPAKLRRFGRTEQGELLYRHAVQEALAEEMVRDRRVIVLGEDVADYGGAFQVTRGLLDAFGRNRVFNTPISEASIVGTALGMAMTGLRPCAEIMYIDFILQAMDQLGNQVAKARYMSAGNLSVPLVIRTTIGGGKGYAGQHSQSLEALITSFPGLKVAIPSTPYDAKGLLKSAIRDDDPVVFIEHQLLYTDKGPVPEGEYLVPFGTAVVRRPGRDITIIAYSYMANVALAAADLLDAQGISAEVIDPRTLVPLDIDTLASSASKTGRVIILSQAPLTGCFGEHMACEIYSRTFKDLHMPVKLITAVSVPPPMARTLEEANLPNPSAIVRAALAMME